MNDIKKEEFDKQNDNKLLKNQITQITRGTTNVSKNVRIRSENVNTQFSNGLQSTKRGQPISSLHYSAQQNNEKKYQEEFKLEYDESSDEIDL